MRSLRGSTFVFLSSKAGRGLDRSERVMLKVMDRLVVEGAAVNLICAPRGPMEGPARERGVTVAPYHLDRLNVVRTVSRVRKYLKRYVPGVAHSTGHEADVLLRWAARGLPVRVVSTAPPSARAYGGKTPLSRPVRRWLDLDSVWRADAIIVETRSAARKLTSSGVSAEKLVVITGGVDIGRVVSEARTRPTLPEGVLVGYAGSVEKGRGLEVLAEAAGLLARRGRAERVVIAGDGPSLRRVSAEAARAGGHAILLGRVESGVAVLSRLEVCCFPSVEPGVPLGLLEAAALGKPIVAAATPGMDELFEDGSEVLLVPPRDPFALADAVVRLLGNPEWAAQMGDRARLRAIDEYSSAAVVERHVRLYERLLVS